MSVFFLNHWNAEKYLKSLHFVKKDKGKEKQQSFEYYWMFILTSLSFRNFIEKNNLKTYNLAFYCHSSWMTATLKGITISSTRMKQLWGFKWVVYILQKQNIRVQGFFYLSPASISGQSHQLLECKALPVFKFESLNTTSSPCISPCLCFDVNVHQIPTVWNNLLIQRYKTCRTCRKYWKYYVYSKM